MLMKRIAFAALLVSNPLFALQHRKSYLTRDEDIKDLPRDEDTVKDARDEDTPKRR